MTARSIWLERLFIAVFADSYWNQPDGLRRFISFRLNAASHVGFEELAFFVLGELSAIYAPRSLPSLCLRLMRAAGP